MDTAQEETLIIQTSTNPQGVQEVCEEVHPHHWVHKRTSGDLRPCWLRLQEGIGQSQTILCFIHFLTSILYQGPLECYDKVQTVVQDAPKEQCSLEPQRTCKHVTKLVPKLEPIEECVDVPKEVCTRSRTNPRKVKRPVVKKWCYVPSEESGLA